MGWGKGGKGGSTNTAALTRGLGGLGPLRFRVQGSGFRVQGSGFRFSVLALGSLALGSLGDTRTRSRAKSTTEACMHVHAFTLRTQVLRIFV